MSKKAAEPIKTAEKSQQSAVTIVHQAGKPAETSQDSAKTAREAEKKLPRKRQLFVDEYLIDLNGTQAAIRAKFSPKTAKEQASRLSLPQKPRPASFQTEHYP